MEGAFRASQEGRQRAYRQREREKEKIAKKVEETVERGAKKRMRREEVRGESRSDPDTKREKHSSKNGMSQTAASASFSSSSHPVGIGAGKTSAGKTWARRSTRGVGSANDPRTPDLSTQTMGTCPMQGNPDGASGSGMGSSGNRD